MTRLAVSDFPALLGEEGVMPAQFAPEPEPGEEIGGIAIGTPGEAGTAYAGHILAAGDDLAVEPALWSPGDPAGSYTIPNPHSGRRQNNIGQSRQTYVDAAYPGFGGGNFYAPLGINPFLASASVLTITASLAPAGTQTILTDPQQTIPQDYVSGRITSYDDFQFRYGVLEFRARFPLGDAQWPALWTLENQHQWPAGAEWGWETYGDGRYQPYLINESGSVVKAAKYTAVDITEWHTWAIRWEVGKLTWYVDGVELDSYTGAVLGQMTRTRAFIINNAISRSWNGGGATSAANPAQFPSEMQVDWWRYWSPEGAAPVVAIAPDVHADAAPGVAFSIVLPEFFTGHTAEHLIASWDAAELTPGWEPGARALPAGMTWDAGTRTLAWAAPVGAGRLGIRVVAHNADGGVAGIRHVYISIAPQLAGGSISAAPPVGEAWSMNVPLFNVFAFGNMPPTSLDVTGMPGWMTWDAATRTLSGTAPDDTPVTVRFTAANALGSVFYDMSVTPLSDTAGEAVLIDEFTGAAGALAGTRGHRISDTPAHGGVAWVNIQGASGVLADRSSYTPAADCWVEGRVNTGASLPGNGMLLVARANGDMSDRVRGGMQDVDTETAALTLSEVVGGVPNVLGSVPVNFGSGLHDLRLEVVGTEARLYHNDVLVLSGTTAVTAAGAVAIQSFGNNATNAVDKSLQLLRIEAGEMT